jgi:hypothetical protein
MAWRLDRNPTRGRIAVTGMRFSTKLCIAALLTWAGLQAVAVGIALPQEIPTDGPAWADFTLRLEAVISVDFLSRASVAAAIIALFYLLYETLRREHGTDAVGAAPSAAAPGQRLSLSTEFLVALGIVAALFAVNLATAEIYPMAWLDEAGYADPAINLALGNGLTSSTWYNVYWGKFWFSYPPLYSVSLAPWIGWLGVNFTTIRLFNVVLVSGSSIALWRYTVRSELFPSTIGRLTVVLLPLLGYGVSFSYRSARPDTLCMLLAALALNASLIADRRWRQSALIAIGILVPWSGLQLAAFAVVLALLIAIWWPRQAVTLFLPVGIGIALGLAALLAFYLANHSLYGYLAATFGSYHTIIGQVLQLVLLHDTRSVHHFRDLPSLLLAVLFEDRSSVFLSVAAILFFVALRRATGTVAFAASRFAVTAAFGVPILMELAGKYWLYYAWMGFLAVGIPLVMSLATAPSTTALLPARRLAFGCIGLALLIGLPLQLWKAYEERGARDYDALRAYVKARVAPGDWVYINPMPYFAVAEQGAVPVLTQYAVSRLAPNIPEDQRQRIKLFIVSPDEVQAAIDRLGGSWKPEGAAFNPPSATRLTWGEWWDYRLVAYRRE